MRRTNIYLTPVQEEGFRNLAAATGQSMAALVRTAMNYMLAHPEQFPDLQGVRYRAGRPVPATRAKRSAARGRA